MTDPFDFDSSMDDAWAGFRSGLADILGGLEQGDIYVLDRPNAPSEQYAQALTFTVTGSGRVRCGLSPVSPEHLPAVSGPVAGVLTKHGWRTLASGELTLSAGRRKVDLVATAATAVIRDQWQVLHPAFFDGPDLTDDEGILADVPVRPGGPAQLQTLVEGILTQLTCDPLVKDHDGDITFTLGGLTSWLRVRPTECFIDLFTILAPDVGTNPHVAAVFDIHGKQWAHVDFLISHKHAVAQTSIDTTVFTPSVVENALLAWFKFMRVGAGAIAREIVRAGVTGEVTAPASEHDDGLPPALLILFHLDPDGAGGLAPHEVAEICEFDRDAILSYLRISTDEAISWRRAADAAADRGDQDDARACRHEADSWTRTKETLRVGLREIVLPDTGGQPTATDVDALRPD